MGRLTHIDDVESRLRVDEGMESTSKEPHRDVSPDVQMPARQASESPIPAKEDDASDIDGPMDIGQKVIIGLASIAFVITIVYALNYWFHFV